MDLNEALFGIYSREEGIRRDMVWGAITPVKKACKRHWGLVFRAPRPGKVPCTCCQVLYPHPKSLLGFACTRRFVKLLEPNANANRRGPYATPSPPNDPKFLLALVPDKPANLCGHLSKNEAMSCKTGRSLKDTTRLPAARPCRIAWANTCN